jgi:hypothetical protein
MDPQDIKPQRDYMQLFRGRIMRRVRVLSVEGSIVWAEGLTGALHGVRFGVDASALATLEEARRMDPRGR